MKRYYKRDWFEYDAVKDNEASVEAIHDALQDAVKRQLIVLAADAEKNILGVPWQYMQRRGEPLRAAQILFSLEAIRWQR